MKAFGTFLGVILGLALLAALLAGGYALFSYVVNLFDVLGPQLEPIVAIASIVALLCAVIIAGGLRARLTNDGAVVQKSNVYERLVLLYADRLMGAEGKMDEQELVKLEQLLALYGSPKVIDVYMELRRAGQHAEKEAMGLLNKLVMAMRADLGRRDLSVKERDLLDLLVGRVELKSVASLT